MIGLLALFATDSWAQSRKFSEPNKQAAQPAAPDQRGTEQVPLVVKVIPSQPSEEQTKKEEAEKHEKAEIDKKLAFETQRIADYTWWLAFITLFVFCIAVLQAGLFVWQLRYMREGMKDAAIAARAARDGAIAATDAARIARNAERPYIVPMEVGLKQVLPPYSGLAYARDFPLVWDVHFDLNNIGRGLGVILGYGINHELSATGEHGGKELLTRENFGGFALAPEGRWTGETSFHQFQVTEDEFTEIVTKGTRTFFVYGYIRYADLFGIVRQTGFSYATTFDGGGNFYLVIEATNRALWYDREEPDNAKS